MEVQQKGKRNVLSCIVFEQECREIFGTHSWGSQSEVGTLGRCCTQITLRLDLQ